MGRMRSRVLCSAAVVSFTLVSSMSALAAAEGWRVVKRGPTVGPGEIAYVGAIVRRPTTIALRAVASKPGLVTLTVTMSCRSGLKTRIGRQQLAGNATYVKAVKLPLAGADNCAVSATGSSAAASLRLELLRGG